MALVRHGWCQENKTNLHSLGTRLPKPLSPLEKDHTQCGLPSWSLSSPLFDWVTSKLFRTSHRIDWENDRKAIVTMEPSPKTIELCANKIQWNYSFSSWQQFCVPHSLSLSYYTVIINFIVMVTFHLFSLVIWIILSWRTGSHHRCLRIHLQLSFPLLKKLKSTAPHTHSQ